MAAKIGVFGLWGAIFDEAELFSVINLTFRHKFRSRCMGYQ